METIELCGHKFQVERLGGDEFKHGVAPFKMIDEDGDTQYVVVTPSNLEEQDTKELKTPKDGHMCAACPNESSALMVASSIAIAAQLAYVRRKTGGIEVRPASDIEKIAGAIGFDVDAMRREVGRLMAEGKSIREIQNILRPRMDEFSKKKGDAPDAGSADAEKKEGEW